MSVARRIEIGGIAILAVAGLVLGAAGSVTAAQLPPAVVQALAGAADVLGWLRWLVVAALVFGVVRAREDPV
jgi:hypothetical protein